MSWISSALRYGLFPVVFIGGNALAISLVAAGTPIWQRIAFIIGVIMLMFLAERIIPYERAWNRDHTDTGRDIAHAVVNTTLNNLNIWLLPLFAGLGLFSGYWPSELPFWLQVVFAALVLDMGITLTHYASHKVELLWRFHAVHHSIERMYGFNGLMKHPVHQALETAGGVMPLLLLGIPVSVVSALVLAVVLQLLLQHSNADYRTGPFKYIFANAEIHRLHHCKLTSRGEDVNFGLFTNFWDYMLGTFHYQPEHVRADALGLRNRSYYPCDYIPQLLEPFRQSPEYRVRKTKIMQS